MAGTIPLARKLGLKPGHVVVVLGKPPSGFVKALAPPDGVRLYQRLRPGPIDVLVYFVDRVAELERRFANLTGRMHPDGGLWVAWPKQASRRPTDLTEDVIRRIGLAGGLVDNKVCAIDDVWSGLRLVVRTENRDAVAYRAEPPLSVRKRRATQPPRRV